MGARTQAAKVGLFVALTGAAAYGIYRFVSPEVSGAPGTPSTRTSMTRRASPPRSRVTIAGIPVGTLDSIRLENGEARLDVKVEGRRRALRQRDARQEERLAPRRVRRRPDAGHARPSQAARRRRDPRHRRRDHARRDHGRGEGDRRQRQGRSPRSSRTSIGTEQGGQNIRLILQNLADATDALNKTDPREPRGHPRDPAQRRRHHAEREPADREDPRERARRHAGRARAHGAAGRPADGQRGRAPRHDRAHRSARARASRARSSTSTASPGASIAARGPSAS